MDIWELFFFFFLVYRASIVFKFRNIQSLCLWGKCNYVQRGFKERLTMQKKYFHTTKLSQVEETNICVTSFQRYCKFSWEAWHMPNNYCKTARKSAIPICLDKVSLNCLPTLDSIHGTFHSNSVSTVCYRGAVCISFMKHSIWNSTCYLLQPVHKLHAL